METGLIVSRAHGDSIMVIKKTAKKGIMQAHTIVFGFDRATDEKSLRLFLQCFTDKTLLDALLPRLHDDEIHATVDFLTGIMHKHLSEKEYHGLFLAD
jgi:hypothetical protein